MLPYSVCVPDLLFENELLSLSDGEKAQYRSLGLIILSFHSIDVEKARKLEIEYPQLSFYDCFAFIASANEPKSILLTGDSGLRTIAHNHKKEVHGVLWVFDEIYRHRVSTIDVMSKALDIWTMDRTVWLRKSDINARKRLLIT